MIDVKPVVVVASICPRCNMMYDESKGHHCEVIRRPGKRCVHHWVSAGLGTVLFRCTRCETLARADDIQAGRV